MGRRALKRVDPSLDLSYHLVPWEQVAGLDSVRRLFTREAPLELEIGSGKGLFLAAAAAARPEVDFLGVEIAARFARFAAARLAKARLPNARVVHGDARRLLASCVPEGTLSAVHVYFPDPWWKQRHAKRRLMSPDFVRQLERALVPGGLLHFWTDVEEYYRAALEAIAASTGLTGPLAVPERSPEHELDYRTHFERRMRLGGQPVYRAEFRKASN